MTTGDPKKIREFQMRPHHVARQIMTNLLTGLFRDDWAAQGEAALPPPEGHVSWFNYWDWKFLERLNFVGEHLGLAAPVFNERGYLDEENIKRVADWKHIYHTLRLLFLMEVCIQVSGSKRFIDKIESLDIKGDSIPPAFMPPRSFSLKE